MRHPERSEGPCPSAPDIGHVPGWQRRSLPTRWRRHQPSRRTLSRHRRVASRAPPLTSPRVATILPPMPDSPRKLLLIGLDAAEASLIERWTDDGTLPTLR